MQVEIDCIVCGQFRPVHKRRRGRLALEDEQGIRFARANQLRVSIHALSREFGKRLLRSGTCPRQARVHPRLDPRLDRFAKLPTFVRQDRLDVTRPVLSVPPTIVLRNSGFQQLDTLPLINYSLPLSRVETRGVKFSKFVFLGER